jgi:hypothetical protein
MVENGTYVPRKKKNETRNGAFKKKSTLGPRCYPQPCGDFLSMLLYLSDDVASAPLPPHLDPGVRRCSAIALRHGGVFVFIWAPNFKFCRQQRDFTAGISALIFFGVELRPSPSSLSSPLHENAAARKIGLKHFSRQHMHAICCCTQHVHVFKVTCTCNMSWGWSIFQGNMCTQHLLLYATCARVQGSMCSQNVLLHATDACTQHLYVCTCNIFAHAARNIYPCAHVWV